MFDIAIIGAGAAGIAAARAVHSASTHTVLMVAENEGATGMTAGWISHSPTVLPDDPALTWLTDVGLRAPGKYTFATLGGTTTTALSGLPSLLDMNTLPDGPLGVVDVIAGPSWSAELVAASLAQTLARQVRIVPAGPHAPRGETPAEFARALEAHGIAEALAVSLRPRVHGCVALLFPPVLGLQHDDVFVRLARTVGIPVGEVGGGPADPPALRLARALTRGIPPGIERITGHATIQDDGTGRACIHVGHRVFHARAVILATGGLAGGGVRFDGMLVEPCAGAPLHTTPDTSTIALPGSTHGMDPVPLFAPDPYGNVRAATAGVRLTSDGRVAGRDGRTPFAPWLFAAGAIVAGGHQAYGLTLAEAIVSGYAAGLRAATSCASTS